MTFIIKLFISLCICNFWSVSVGSLVFWLRLGSHEIIIFSALANNTVGWNHLKWTSNGVLLAISEGATLAPRLEPGIEKRMWLESAVIATQFPFVARFGVISKWNDWFLIRIDWFDRFQLQLDWVDNESCYTEFMVFHKRLFFGIFRWDYIINKIPIYQIRWI